MAVVHEYYPSSFKKAVCFYSLIEKLFVFTVKRKLRCTLGLIHSLYISFDTSKTHLEHTDDIFLSEFRVLSALCPLGIQLAQVINREDTDSEGMAQHTQQITLSDIELSFPLFSGCSPSQSKKRHKMLETAIDEYLKKEYLEHSDKEMIKKNSFTSIKKNGWPAGFDCELIALPIPPKMLNELSSMQPPSLVSVSVPDSDASSVVQDMDSTDKDEEDSAEPSTEPSLDFLVDKSGKDSISLTALGGGNKVLDRLKAQLSYRDQIAHIETIEGRPASFRELVCSPSSFIDKKLLLLVGERIGVKRFYAHQAQAINHILEGKHVVVSTATSSGKSIIYNLPIISAVLQNSKVTAMYLFPTKALAQDQLRVLTAIICGHSEAKGSSKSTEMLPVRAMTCDGDTGHYDRMDVKEHANIILTNPDTLHCTFLPHHKDWTRVLKNLKFVVIDESHQYKGAFGCHVACVLRRLVRICAHYGSHPLFICCSATIANPAAHFSKLLPLPCIGGLDSLAVIDSTFDGSPHGERVFVIWNPPLKFGVEIGQMKDETEPAPSDEVAKQSSAATAAPAPVPATATATTVPGVTVPVPVVTAASATASAAAQLIKLSGPSPAVVQAHIQTKTETQTATNTVTNTAAHTVTVVAKAVVPSGKREGGRLSFAEESPTEEEEDDPLSLFLEGCEDRPQTLSSDFVGYHRGWQRSRSRNGKNRKEQQGQRAPTIVRVPLALAPVDAVKTDKKPHSNLEQARMPRFRLSSITEMSQLLSFMVRLRVRTLAFCGVRKLVELVLKYCLSDLKSSSESEHLAECVASYRGGYTKEERRVIEAELFSGRLLGVTATCALELGMDIGDLDATLHLGFPRSFSSLWQQAGRAGRSGRPSLSILVCHDSPVDQFFARNPTVLLNSPHEPATLNPDNIHVLRGHLLCAAMEITLNAETWTVGGHKGLSAGAGGTGQAVTFDDSQLWGVRYFDAAHSLLDTQDLVVSYTHNRVSMHDDTPPTLPSDAPSHPHFAPLPVPMPLPLWRMHPLHRLGSVPSKDVSLRLIDPITINVVDTSVGGGGQVIDSLGYSRAFYELFEGAIYMHRAKQFLVHKLDLGSKRALCKPARVGYYTACRNRTDVNVLKVLESASIFKTGTVQVVASVYGYGKIWLGTGETFEEGECSLPNLEFETNAVWIDLPLSAKKEMDTARHDITASIHAVNHVLVSVCSMFAECDENDVATEHEISSSATATPYRLLLYDKHAGGLGVCDELYCKRSQLLQRALELLTSCPCGAGSNAETHGCPSCLLDQRCSSYNKRLAKKGAIKLLQLLIHLQERGERDAAQQAQEDEEQESMSGGVSTADTTPLWGSPPSRKLAPPITEVVYAQECRRKRPGAPSGTAGKASRAGSSITVGASDPLDDTPRKMRRLQALRNARFNQTGRTKSVMTVQKTWTELNHQFLSDRDL